MLHLKYYLECLKYECVIANVRYQLMSEVIEDNYSGQVCN